MFTEMGTDRLSGTTRTTYRIAAPILLCLVVTARLMAQDHPPEGLTGYPLSVYMQFFQACFSDKRCTRTDNLHVDPLPKGCCVLIVTNGNGRGKDEVGSFEVFLNGKRVIPPDHSPSARATVTVQTNNSIKLSLTGESGSRVLVLIAYDSRQSK